MANFDNHPYSWFMDQFLELLGGRESLQLMMGVEGVEVEEESSSGEYLRFILTIKFQGDRAITFGFLVLEIDWRCKLIEGVYLTSVECDGGKYILSAYTTQYKKGHLRNAGIDRICRIVKRLTGLDPMLWR